MYNDVWEAISREGAGSNLSAEYRASNKLEEVDPFEEGRTGLQQVVNLVGTEEGDATTSKQYLMSSLQKCTTELTNKAASSYKMNNLVPASTLLNVEVENAFHELMKAMFECLEGRSAFASVVDANGMANAMRRYKNCVDALTCVMLHSSTKHVFHLAALVFAAECCVKLKNMFIKHFPIEVRSHQAHFDKELALIAALLTMVTKMCSSDALMCMDGHSAIDTSRTVFAQFSEKIAGGQSNMHTYRLPNNETMFMFCVYLKNMEVARKSKSTNVHGIAKMYRLAKGMCMLRSACIQCYSFMYCYIIVSKGTGPLLLYLQPQGFFNASCTVMEEHRKKNDIQNAMTTQYDLIAPASMK